MIVTTTHLRSALNALVLCHVSAYAGGDGVCCIPNGTPGCEEPDCEAIVCATTPSCCDIEWDQSCAGAAVLFCEECADFGGCPGTGGCYEANGTPGCEEVGCCEQVCAVDLFCCTVTWDQNCADLAFQVCLGCGGVDAGACCEANGTPACDDTECCELVCSLTPACCGFEWDSSCALDAQLLCQACVGACCLGSGACSTLNLGDCNGAGGVYKGPATSCAGADCVTVSCGPDAGDCCANNGTPGCDDPDCCEIVCSTNPFCCTITWDLGCAADALTSCQSCTLEFAGACCFGNGFCDVLPPSDCDDLLGLFQGAFTSCETVECPLVCGDGAAGNCCEKNGTPGCDDPDCCEIVCASDPFCCGAAWDGSCAGTAFEVCGVCEGACCLSAGACPSTSLATCAAQGGDFQGVGTSCADADCVTTSCGPEAGLCCVANGSPGCDDEECCQIVCAADPLCCTIDWDSTCAADALAQCEPCFEFGGACCLPGGACDVLLPDDCADAMGVFQGAFTPCDELQCTLIACGPGSGDCFVSNGTPGCDDVECCEAICSADPFCCVNDWDTLCVNIALANPACDVPQVECPDGTEDESEACGEDSNGGCDGDPVTFELVECGDTLCGTAWAENDSRDTDWFRLDLDGETTITVTVNAEFPLAFFKIGGASAGSCGTPTVEINGSTTGVITTTVGAGDHYFFVAQLGFNGFPCGDGQVDYVISFACVSSCAGDLDFDGDTDSADLNILLGNFGCDPAAASDCCVANGTPGCEDEACEALICAQDAFCCNTAWDIICADAAIVTCGVCDCPGDLDGDGDTDSGDLNILLGGFGCGN